ncbi:Protein DCT-9 [Aphelenchoides avenae]|nr:Protein DCT-9 [Aphelenchus avenae]
MSLEGLKGPAPATSTPDPKTTFLGDMPDNELLLQPRWLIFSSAKGYSKPQYGTFTITNRDNESVAFRLRLKERHFPKLSITCGILKPAESAEITVLIPTADQWPRDPLDYAGSRHKVLIESLFLPANWMSLIGTAQNAKSFCSRLFTDTNYHKPQTRLYTKLNFILPKVSDEWTLKEAKDLTASEVARAI